MCVVCKYARRYLQDNKVAIEPARGQISFISMRGHRLAVRLAVPGIAHDAVSHCKNFAIVAKPISIGRVAKLVRSYFERVAT